MFDKKNIILVGFMGTGKTCVGRKLAQRTGRRFIDTDKEIERLVELKIPLIFKKHGEIRFRSEETLMLKKICECKNNIVSTGGGVVTKEENIEIIKNGGLVVWLTATPDTILTRVGKGKGRPLLKGKNLGELVDVMLKRREPLYKKAADIVVATDKLTVEQVVLKIIRKIEEARQ